MNEKPTGASKGQIPMSHNSTYGDGKVVNNCNISWCVWVRLLSQCMLVLACQGPGYFSWSLCCDAHRHYLL